MFHRNASKLLPRKNTFFAEKKPFLLSSTHRTLKVEKYIGADQATKYLSLLFQP